MRLVTAATHDPDCQTWRASWALRGVAISYAVGAALFAVWIVGVAAGEGVWLQGFAFAVVFIVVPAIVGLRYALRARVVVTADCLVVFTTFSQREIPWSEIRDASTGYAGITLLLRDGSTFLTGAVQKSNMSAWLRRETRADELVDIILRRSQTHA